MIIRRYICLFSILLIIVSLSVPLFAQNSEAVTCINETTPTEAAAQVAMLETQLITPVFSEEDEQIIVTEPILETLEYSVEESTNQTENIPSEEIAHTENNDFVEETTPEEFEYEGREYVVPHLSLNRTPYVTESGYVEKYTEVPHYFQTYYPKTRYGDSNLRKSGCGIASLAMVLTYLLDEEITPDVLAKQYFNKKVPGGSCYSLFSDSAKDYGITCTQVWDWESVITALEEGHVIIANTKAPSVFTQGGHFIVLAGILENGKILVRDPNLYNYSIWSSKILKEGFKNGFGDQSLMYYSFPCWIYQLKDLEALGK